MLGTGDKEQMRQLGKYGAIGLEMGLAVVIGMLIGSYLDRRFDWAPYGQYAGLAAGIGAAAKGLIRVTRDYQREIEEARTQKEEAAKEVEAGD